MASGRAAALAVHSFLTGEAPPENPLSLLFIPAPGHRTYPEITTGDSLFARAEDAGASSHLTQGALRAEVALGLTEDQVHSETSRCLQCGVCSECSLCDEACSAAGAISHGDGSFEAVEHAGVVIIADPAAAPGVKGEDVIRAYSSKAIRPDVLAMMLRGFAAAAEAVVLLDDGAARMQGHGISFSPPAPQLSQELRIGVFVCRCNDSLGWDPGIGQVHFLPSGQLHDRIRRVGCLSMHAGGRRFDPSDYSRKRPHTVYPRLLRMLSTRPRMHRVHRPAQQAEGCDFPGYRYARAMAETCNMRGEALALLKNDPPLAVSPL